MSSSTPGLRALAEARSRAPEADPAGRMLIVAMPVTGGTAPDLPSVARERDHLLALLPEHARELREGAAATRAAVRKALDTCTMAHFGCHGEQDVARPLRSGLSVGDGTLTVADLAEPARHHSLAVLSACRTATVGPTSPDEAISLAAALHHAGWEHVVATLWSVWDDASADITADFFDEAFDGGRVDPGRAATALHHAVRRARAKAPLHPSRWAPFLHIGP